jgi:hypothetical protein
MSEDRGPIRAPADGQVATAERQLLAALKRLHRREPLRPSFRVDRVVDEMHVADARPSVRHRGSQRVTLGMDALLAVIDGLVGDARLERDGRQLSLPGQGSALEPIMRERVDRLLEGLRSAGAEPPRVDSLAARLGIPPGVIDQLRSAGELVAVAPGIDYPRDAWQRLDERIAGLSRYGPLSVSRVREALHTSRRHAEALLAYRRAARERGRPRPRPRR